MSSKDGIKCSICNDTGFIFYVDDNGNDIAKRCECWEKRKKEIRIRFAEIPDAFKDMTLSTFNVGVYADEKSKQTIRLACKIVKLYLDNIESAKESGMGLYIHSETKGSGKTRMAASIANELISMNYQVKFAVSTQILQEIRNTYDDRNTGYSENQLLDSLYTAQILIIDDFGTEKVTGWVNDKFYQIINERYINKKITILTSNYTLSSCGYDSRITNRLLERTYDVEFPEESIREHIAARNNANMLKSVFLDD